MSIGTREAAVAKDEAQWPKGTRISHQFPGHHPGRGNVIWLLTDRWFPLTKTTVYEGKWPD